MLWTRRERRGMWRGLYTTSRGACGWMLLSGACCGAVHFTLARHSCVCGCSHTEGRQALRWLACAQTDAASEWIHTFAAHTCTHISCIMFCSRKWQRRRYSSGYCGSWGVEPQHTCTRAAGGAVHGHAHKTSWQMHRITWQHVEPAKTTCNRRCAANHTIHDNKVTILKG